MPFPSTLTELQRELEAQPFIFLTKETAKSLLKDFKQKIDAKFVDQKQSNYDDKYADIRTADVALTIDTMEAETEPLMSDQKHYEQLKDTKTAEQNAAVKAINIEQTLSWIEASYEKELMDDKAKIAIQSELNFPTKNKAVEKDYAEKLNIINIVRSEAFKFLSLRDRINAATVSKGWHDVFVPQTFRTNIQILDNDDRTATIPKDGKQGEVVITKMERTAIIRNMKEEQKKIEAVLVNPALRKTYFPQTKVDKLEPYIKFAGTDACIIFVNTAALFRGLKEKSITYQDFSKLLKKKFSPYVAILNKYIHDTCARERGDILETRIIQERCNSGTRFGVLGLISYFSVKAILDTIPKSNALQIVYPIAYSLLIWSIFILCNRYRTERLEREHRDHINEALEYKGETRTAIVQEQRKLKGLLDWLHNDKPSTQPMPPQSQPDAKHQVRYTL